MSLNSTQYEALAEQIESILKDPETATAQLTDENLRRRLVEGGRKLATSLERPKDTWNRIGNSHLQLPLALVGVESGVFATLAAEPRPFSISELAQKTGVDGGLLKRLLRYYQATGVVSQIDDNTYRSNNVCRALSNDDYADTFRWANKITAKGGLNLADWLQSNSWTVSVGKMPTAWTSSVPTDRKPYEYLAENPWALKLAQAHMRINWDKKPIFLDALDFGSRFEQDTTSSTVLFVDVGGSTGSVSLALRQRCPDLPGRVLLQDRPEVVEQVKAQLLSSAGIEAEVYDIFTPQPVKGARVYYMRKIFHAWGDETCKEILLNAKAGMTDQSVLLIDEIVFPERGATVQGAQMDIELMICAGGIERTKAQWESVLNSAGLKMLEVVHYDKNCEDAVIVVGLN